MSVTGEFSSDIYRRMTDLQEKLKQSEAERLRLEEMFDLLLKTFKEDEKMRLKNLESRYQVFLEDCARRSDRNEKILSSIKRVESSASILYAKTERLKQLRILHFDLSEKLGLHMQFRKLLRRLPVDFTRTNENHYEAYLGRVMPRWKQGSPLHYVSSQVAFVEDAEQRKPSYREFEDALEPSCSNNYSYGFFDRGDQAKRQSWMSDVGQRSRSVSRRERDSDDRFLESPPCGTLPESRGGVFLGFPDEEEADREASMTRRPGARFAAPRWDSVKKFPRETTVDVDDGLSEEAAPSDASAGVPGKMRGFPARSISEYLKCEKDERPMMMTREPVKIKKPEFVVGKLKSNVADSRVKSEESGDDKDSRSPCEDDVRVTQPPVIRELTSDGRNREERPTDKVVEEKVPDEAVAERGRQLENAYRESDVKKEEERERGKDDTDVSQSLTEGGNSSGNKEENDKVVESSHFVEEEEEEEEEEGSGVKIDEGERCAGKDRESNEEDVYEDNEEAYPESYYEQPAKPVLSNDIVSNVILEEDESEVMMAEETEKNSADVRDKVEADNRSAAMHDRNVEVFDAGNVAVARSDEGVAFDAAMQPRNAESEDGVASNYRDERAAYASRVSDGNYQNSECYNQNATNYQYSAYGNASNYEIPVICEDEEDADANYESSRARQYGVRAEQYPDNAEEYAGKAEQYAGNAEEYGTHAEQYMGNAEQYMGNAEQYMGNAEQHGVHAEQYAGNAEQYGGREMAYEEYPREVEPPREIINYESRVGEREHSYEHREPYGEANVSDNAYYGAEGASAGDSNAGNARPGDVPGGNGSLAADHSRFERDGYKEGVARDSAPLVQNNLAHLLESDSESFQMEHGSGIGNEDSDFDFSVSQK